MKYRKLGRTGMEVSSQCLGSMMFGPMGNNDVDDCVAIIHEALDSGINFIDTADVYSRGVSEEIVGRALKGRRDDVVLATKFFNPMSDDRNSKGGSRRWIMKAVEDSLRRLGVDYIDLYQMHRMDWSVDLDVTMSALTDLVRSGKVRHLGTSCYQAEWIVEAQHLATTRGYERFLCEQPQYSIFAREIETAVLPTAQRYGMGVIPWSPLAGGLLTGKYRKDAQVPTDARYAKKRDGSANDMTGDPRLDLVDQLDAIAKGAGLSMSELALGFVDAHPAITSTIIGPKSMAQLKDNIACADVELSNDVLDAIDKVVRPGTMAPRTINMAPNPPMEAKNRRR